MNVKIRKGNANLLLLTAYCLLLTVFSGCGEHVTGTNAELDVAHTGGPDCTQSGCHPGFGAGGTVYDGAAGLNPVSGVTVNAKSADTGEIVLGITDSLGNFHYDTGLNGYFNISVDGGTTWSNLHELPALKGCNSCHNWPVSGGASGRIF